MTLLTIAELLAGEALISPGGPVDRQTAAGDDTQHLWPYRFEAVESRPAEALVPAAEEALVTV